jgi:phosphomannomutase
MQEIRFGTDGFRGIIGDNFTFENVRRISRALAVYLKGSQKLDHKKGVIVGYDKRFLSDRFAECAAKELAASGIPVFLAKLPVPTQAVSLFVRNNELPCGIVLTASHNPPEFNGYKIKDCHGSTSPKAMTREIEQIICRGFNNNTKTKAAAITAVDPTGPYIKFLKNYLNLDLIKKNKFSLLVDAMHGVGAGLADRVLKNTQTSIDTIRPQRDVLFGGVNPEPIIQNLGALKTALKAKKYDLGIALDGDADRIGAMCPNGELISSHFAICLILLHLFENKKMTGKVVKSITTTTLVEKIAAHYRLEVDEVPVGFKNIAQKMITEDILIGGEESGGIGFKNYMPERDGILSGLLLLELMAYRKKGIISIIKQMQEKFGKYYYLRNDLKIKKPVRLKYPVRILGKKVIETKTYDGTKFIMQDESWLLVRTSGTEPVVRIYAESKSPVQTKALIEYGCRLV